MPLSAVWIVPARNLRVTFDRPLVPGILDPANWSVRFANNRRSADAAEVLVGSPTIARSSYPISGIPEIGDNVCDYLAAPPDVVGDPDLTPAGAFVGFPVS